MIYRSNETGETFSENAQLQPRISTDAVSDIVGFAEFPGESSKVTLLTNSWISKRRYLHSKYERLLGAEADKEIYDQPARQCVTVFKEDITGWVMQCRNGTNIQLVIDPALDATTNLSPMIDDMCAEIHRQ